MCFGAAFWAILDSDCVDSDSYHYYRRDVYCSCLYHGDTQTCKSLILFILSTSLNFSLSVLQSRGILQAMLKFNSVVLLDAASCSDLKTVREATGAVTIFFALFTIVSFVGSIYGCIGTCCASRVNYAWYRYLSDYEDWTRFQVRAISSKCEVLKWSPVRIGWFEMTSHTSKSLLKVRWINFDPVQGLDQYTS